MTASPVQPASAAMPREEDVARALCIADGKDPDFDYDPLGLGRPAGTDLRWRCYLSQARAVLALFAPILAEKERLAGIADHAARHWQQTQAAFQACLDATGSKDGAELVDKAARALAAEAALAAERERCAKVAEDHGMLVSNEPIGKACSRNIAAAIRAQGE